MKTVSQLDPEGFFIGPAEAHESPLEPGVFLIPGGAVDREPPKALQPGKRYRPWGTGWRGEDVPEPPAPEPIPEPSRADQIRGRLVQIDQESIRPARAVATALAARATVPTFDANKLATLEAEAAALRAELAGLQG